MEAIIYTRQPDNTFQKVDNWPKGVRRAKLQIDTQEPFGSYTLAEALKVMDCGLTRNLLKHDRYAIIPLRGEPMPDEVKEIFRAIQVEKKDKPLITCTFDGCNNQFPKAKGRYPKRFCKEHESRKN